MNTIFSIEILKEGFLCFRQFKPSVAHTDREIYKYNKAIKKVCGYSGSDGKDLSF